MSVHVHVHVHRAIEREVFKCSGNSGMNIIDGFYTPIYGILLKEHIEAIPQTMLGKIIIWLVL